MKCVINVVLKYCDYVSQCLQLLTSLAGSDVKHLLWNASLISGKCVSVLMPMLRTVNIIRSNFI